MRTVAVALSAATVCVRGDASSIASLPSLSKTRGRCAIEKRPTQYYDDAFYCCMF